MNSMNSILPHGMWMQFYRYYHVYAHIFTLISIDIATRKGWQDCRCKLVIHDGNRGFSHLSERNSGGHSYAYLLHICYFLLRFRNHQEKYHLRIVISNLESKCFRTNYCYSQLLLFLWIQSTRPSQLHVPCTMVHQGWRRKFLLHHADLQHVHLRFGCLRSCKLLLWIFLGHGCNEKAVRPFMNHRCPFPIGWLINRGAWTNPFNSRFLWW